MPSDVLSTAEYRSEPQERVAVVYTTDDYGSSAAAAFVVAARDIWVDVLDSSSITGRAQVEITNT